MKLVSSIIALAVFGQVAPALAVCALCPMQNSLSDFFDLYRKSAAHQLLMVHCSFRVQPLLLGGSTACIRTEALVHAIT